jgi:ribonucleoside-diphosphate reductase alpha chain
MFLNNTSCNLASLNLVKFLNNDAHFDIDSFKHACRIFFIAQEILVDFSSYPTREIARNSHDYRPIGLGYANLGTLLMLLGQPYASETGRATASCITAILGGQAYYTSAEIAAYKKPFAQYIVNINSMNNVMNKHLAAIKTINESFCDYTLYTSAYNIWNDALKLGEKNGYRNAQATVLAPSGTIGLLMDCDTTGIEPDFSLVKYKKLAGGGNFKIVNQSVEKSLKHLKYTDSQIKEIIDYIDTNETIENAPHLLSEHLPIFDCANRCGKKGKRFLAPIAHLKMMAAVQPFLSGSISKTVNIPNEATVDDVAEIYYQGWLLGLKSVALYRDGCKASQPLSTKKEKDEEINSSSKQQYESTSFNTSTSTSLSRPAGVRIRLPTKRAGFTQEARVGGHKIFLRTGQYEDGTLGEIFIDMHKEGAAMRSIMGCFAMSISLGLQYGVPLSTYVEQFTFTNFEPNGVVEGHPNIKMVKSMIDYIFRVLGIEYLQQYDLAQVKPGERYELPSPLSMQIIEPKKQSDAPVCSQCGHLTIRDGACYRCTNCGTTTGCS